MIVNLFFCASSFALLTMSETIHDDLCNLFMFWYGFDKIRHDVFKYVCTESSLRHVWDEIWFAKTHCVDQVIRCRFTDLVEKAIDYQPTCLIEKVAKMILYDQVPRNIYRLKPQAYMYDHIAKEIAYELLTLGPTKLPVFVMMSVVLTLIHSEEVDDHETVVHILMEMPQAHTSGVIKTLHEIAKRHKERVMLFGRLPERAKIKGCSLDYEEQVYLDGLV